MASLMHGGPLVRKGACNAAFVHSPTEAWEHSEAEDIHRPSREGMRKDRAAVRFLKSQ